ncbi:hypothetical protein MalM25_15100 [Planctomycetes bacterium MalM25]|nr:hypothetical protein MalM25_15100 [Planctomycetes bacterium MalM25]
MPSDPTIRRPRPPRRAYSLVEVVAATALMAATLVPAMQLVRLGVQKSSETDRQQLLSLYAASQIEQRLASIAMTWASATYTGDFAADGHPNIRFETACSDDPLAGGLTDQLMDVRTTVYDDANGDDTLTPGERSCSCRTKIGKFATYEALGT